MLHGKQCRVRNWDPSYSNIYKNCEHLHINHKQQKKALFILHRHNTQGQLSDNMTSSTIMTSCLLDKYYGGLHMGEEGREKRGKGMRAEDTGEN